MKNKLILSTAAIMLTTAVLSVFLLANDNYSQYWALGAVCYLVSMAWLGAFIYANVYWEKKEKTPAATEVNSKIITTVNKSTSILKEKLSHVNLLQR